MQAINKIDGTFSDQDARLFEAFASQAAVAIENARLFSSLIEEKSKVTSGGFSPIRMVVSPTKR